jgi:hypothetical protein
MWNLDDVMRIVGQVDVMSWLCRRKVDRDMMMINGSKQQY